MAFLGLNSSCSSARKIASVVDTKEAEKKHVLQSIFDKSREVLILDRSLAPVKVAESELVQYLSENPDKLDNGSITIYGLLQPIVPKRDITKHMRLMPPPGQPGYSELKVHVSHPYYNRSFKLMPASNLVDVWREMIQKAEKQIVINVYDFDLVEIAEELVKKAQAGVAVQVGVDINVALTRPETSAIVKMLTEAKITVVQVSALSLNGQKMMAVDWDDQEKAMVLFSSGNLTKSCLDPGGDLAGLKVQHKESIANANNIVTMKSWLLANLVAHELSKTFVNKVRGLQFPLNGSYQITGPGVDPMTTEVYPERSLVVAFTPGGGYRNINKNIISHFINISEGPYRLVQYSFTSEEVSKALLKKARAEFASDEKFSYMAVGDAAMSVRDESQFLKMSGLKFSEEDNKYIEDPKTTWSKVLSSKQLDYIRVRTRIAPDIYGLRAANIENKFYSVSSRMHHKIMRAGDFAVIGSSFNFSQGSEANNEQILVFKDPEAVMYAEGITRWLYEKSIRSLQQETDRRNIFRKGKTSGTGLYDPQDAMEESAASP